MPSKRTVRTRSLHKSITPEILELFDRSLQLQAQGHIVDGSESDELRAVNRQLQIRARRIFGERWSFGNPTPADPCFDGPCFIGSPANVLNINWPDLQRDRQVLLAAHTERQTKRVTHEI
jgi:hypothetical protein